MNRQQYWSWSLPPLLLVKRKIKAQTFGITNLKLNVSRFHTTSDGGSAYDEVEIPLNNEHIDGWGNHIAMSERFTSPSVCVFEISDEAFQDFHNAPQRQLCVVLEGIWEVETSDGERRSWKPGEMFFPDDVSGKGHISRVLQGPVRILFVPLEPDFDIKRWEKST